MPAPLTKWLGSGDANRGDIAPRQFVPAAAPWETIVPSDASPVESPATRRFTKRRMSVAALVLVAVIAVILLAVAWRSEANAHHAADAKAALLATQLASTRTSLARTRTELAQVTSIAQRRRAVLVQAGATLRKVDALLTKADALKSAAVKAEDANTAWGNSVVDSYNYLSDNDYYSLDISYLNSLVDTSSALLTQAYAAEAAYGRAVKGFGNNADSFTQSVRALQRQLKSVTEG
jgi:hypothetical protein